mgnify:CR=1 FL=1
MRVEVTTDPLAIIHRLWQSADNTASNAFFAAGVGHITPRQRTLLQAISTLEARLDRPPNQTEIEAASGIDRSTLSEMVRRLVDKKLVRRTRSRADNRMYQVAVSKDGLAVLARLDTADKTILKELADPNGEPRKLIKRLAAML